MKQFSKPLFLTFIFTFFLFESCQEQEETLSPTATPDASHREFVEEAQQWFDDQDPEFAATVDEAQKIDVLWEKAVSDPLSNGSYLITAPALKQDALHNHTQLVVLHGQGATWGFLLEVDPDSAYRAEHGSRWEAAFSGRVNTYDKYGRLRKQQVFDDGIERAQPALKTKEIGARVLSTLRTQSDGENGGGGGGGGPIYDGGTLADVVVVHGSPTHNSSGDPIISFTVSENGIQNGYGPLASYTGGTSGGGPAYTLAQVTPQGHNFHLNLSYVDPASKRAAQLEYLAYFGGEEGKDLLNFSYRFISEPGLTMGDIADLNAMIERTYLRVKGEYLLYITQGFAETAEIIVNWYLVEALSVAGVAAVVKASQKVLNSAYFGQVMKPLKEIIKK